jgi:hypothetical protein
MVELPEDEHFGRLGFLFLGAICYLPLDLNKRHRTSYELELSEWCRHEATNGFCPWVLNLFHQLERRWCFGKAEQKS